MGEGVDAAVVEEAVAAHLLARLRPDAPVRQHPHPEHADLRVEVAEVGDLHVLGLALEALPAVRAEEAGDRVAHVAGLAGVPAVDVRELGVRETVGFLDAEGVVERPHGVRRQGQLQREGGELLHLGGPEDAVPPEEPLEGHGEVVEGVGLVAGGAAGLGAGVGPEVPVEPVAAPVEGPVGRQTAQGLGRHRALHRVEGRPRRCPTGTRLGCSPLLDHRVRVAEVPRQAVDVAEDVTARSTTPRRCPR